MRFITHILVVFGTGYIIPLLLIESHISCSVILSEIKVCLGPALTWFVLLILFRHWHHFSFLLHWDLICA